MGWHHNDKSHIQERSRGVNTETSGNKTLDQYPMVCRNNGPNMGKIGADESDLARRHLLRNAIAAIMPSGYLTVGQPKAHALQTRGLEYVPSHLLTF